MVLMCLGAVAAVTVVTPEGHRAELKEPVVYVKEAVCVENYEVVVPSTVVAGLGEARYWTVPCEEDRLRFVEGLQAHPTLVGMHVAKTRVAKNTEVLTSFVAYQKTVCVGFNQDGSCKHAAQPINILNDENMKVTCSDCFVGLSANFVLDIDFWKKHFLMGFQDGTLSWAAVMDAVASKAWSFEVDKTWQVAKFNLIDVHKFGVPIHVWVEVPLHLLTSLALNGHAEAQVGVRGVGNLGGLYVENNKGTWNFVTPQPSFNFDVVKKLNYDIVADASASLTPSIILHVTDVASTTLSFVPSTTVHAKATNGNVCANADYDIQLQWLGDVNLDWIKYQKSWNKGLFDKKGEIVHTC
jgi:hypothetical protein